MFFNVNSVFFQQKKYCQMVEFLNFVNCFLYMELFEFNIFLFLKKTDYQYFMVF